MAFGPNLTEEQYEALREEGWLPPPMRGELSADLTLILAKVRRMHARHPDRQSKEHLHTIEEIVSKWK